MLNRLDFEKSITKKPISFDKVVHFSSDGISMEKIIQKKTIEDLAGGEDALSANSSDASDEGQNMMAIKPITVCINTRTFLWNNHESFITPESWKLETDIIMNNALKFLHGKIQGKKLFFNSLDFRQPYLYAYCDSTKLLYEIDTVTFEFETMAKGYEYTSGICTENCLVLAEETKGKPHIVKLNWIPDKVTKTKSENQTFSESAMPDRDLTLTAQDSTSSATNGKITSFGYQYKKTLQMPGNRLVTRHRIFSSDLNRVVYLTGQNSMAAFATMHLKLSVVNLKGDCTNDVCINNNYAYWVDMHGCIGKITVVLPMTIYKVSCIAMPTGSTAALIQASNRFVFVLVVQKSGVCHIETMTNTNLRLLPLGRVEFKDVSPDNETYIMTTIKSNRSQSTFLTVCLDKSIHLFNVCFSKTTRRPLVKLNTLTNDEEPITKVDISNFSLIICSAETAKCHLIKY